MRRDCSSNKSSIAEVESRTVTCGLRLVTVIIIRQAELLFLLIKIQLVVDALILVKDLVLHNVRHT